uniref:Uncharacterized protein n=1 Tax=Romanomermis culicivorax TaxID=13658 RepID=A0A915JV52_ROMCU
MERCLWAISTTTEANLLKKVCIPFLKYLIQRSHEMLLPFENGFVVVVFASPGVFCTMPAIDVLEWFDREGGSVVGIPEKVIFLGGFVVLVVPPVTNIIDLLRQMGSEKAVVECLI